MYPSRGGGGTGGRHEDDGRCPLVATRLDRSRRWTRRRQYRENHGTPAGGEERGRESERAADRSRDHRRRLEDATVPGLRELGGVHGQWREDDRDGRYDA